MPAFKLIESAYDMPSQPIDPVVRVLAQVTVNGEAHVSKGSGFFVDDWHRSLITAAHVVVPNGIAAERVTIDVTLADGSGGVRVFACAFARPEDESPDAA